MTPPKDPYRTLGLARGATLDEVRAAYRALAKVNHPDVAGSAALPRFLAIKAAYEQILRTGAARGSVSRGAPTPPERPSSAEPDRADATHRAYGGRTRRTRTGPRPSRDRPPPTGPASSSGGAAADDREGPGKATLGSTSYDGAEGQPFEPDWGGASWYGTTSGTYWTINPKEYADPRKHGPEYQARARRSARARPAAGALDGATDDGDPGEPSVGSALGGPPPPETETPAGSPAPPRTGERGPDRPAAATWRDARPGPASPAGPPARPVDEPPPDLAAAATDLGRALTDERTAHGRWRLVQAIVGWLPIAFGLGWLVGEFTGCGRFAATCDGVEGAAAPLIALIALGVLALAPTLATLAAAAAIAVVIAAVPVTLALSAGGAATAPETRTMILGSALVIGWLAGLAVAIVRRARGIDAARPLGSDRTSGPERDGPATPPGPVS